MTSEEFELILDEDMELSGDMSCSILKGLNIIAKYLPNKGIQSAEHDIIFSCSIEELANSGITVEDATLLSGLGWMETNGYLSSFV